MSGFLGLGRARRVLLLAGLVFAALPAGSALAKTIGQTGGTAGCVPESVIGDANYVVPSGRGTITTQPRGSRRPTARRLSITKVP